MKNEGLKLFYSYSQKDEKFREELEEHLSILRRKNLIDDWHFRKIQAGERWENLTLKTLSSSDIILLLVSSSFIHSEYCYSKEMRIALNMHRDGKCIVIPILLRPCNTNDAPFLELQGLPKNLIPISKWNNKDEAWSQISESIERVCKDFKNRKRTQTLTQSEVNASWSSISESDFSGLCKELFTLNERLIRTAKPSIDKLHYSIVFHKNHFREIRLEELEMHECDTDTVLLFVNYDLTNSEKTEITMDLSSEKLEVMIWDREIITKKIQEQARLSFSYNLSFNDYHLHNLKYQEAEVNFLQNSNFINRTKEINIIESFFKDNTKSILTITGLPGVGKSVLANHMYHRNREAFRGACIIRIKETTSSFDILHILNEALLSMQILDFNKIYSNSNCSDEVRVNTLINIFNRYRIFVLFDNFEDIVEDTSIKNLLLSHLFGDILAVGCKSKLVITSRTPPFVRFNNRSNEERLFLKPIEEEVFYKEYLPKLPRIYNRIHHDGKRNTHVEKELYKMTGGVPLSLDLLEKYLNFLPIEGALNSSNEDLERIIINDILNTINKKYEEVLVAIALFNDSIEYSFLKYFEITNDDIEVLISTGILIYNVNHYKYLMHAFVRLTLVKKYSNRVTKRLRKKLIDYLQTTYQLDSYDSLNALLIQKKKLQLMLDSAMYDEAAEHLGRIATRLISVNSVDEVKKNVSVIKPNVSKNTSEIWLLNVEAHVLDYFKEFEETQNLYKKMYEKSRDISDIELKVLSESNYATTFRREGLFDIATAMYETALEKARRYELYKLQGSLLNNMGQNYNYNENLTLAVKCLEECIEVRRNMQDEFRLAASLTHYGGLCLKVFQRWTWIKSLFNATFEGRKAQKEFWLENAFVQINNSIELQENQKNFWLIERSYEQLALYWSLKGNQKKSTAYKILARNNRTERGIENDSEYN